MIISRTPLRISFVGGGSDLPEFYKDTYGAVVSTSIDKYIYINVNKKFDDSVRVSYSKTEIVDSTSKLKHELVRETLKMLKINNGIEITSISDIPSEGTGLGSSSTFTVGVLNALNAYLGNYSSSEFLASTACEIELEKCKKPIGKQDQYAAAYGGFNFIRFNPDESVVVEPIICPKGTIEAFEENLLFFYTGKSRSSSTILQTQSASIKTDIRKKVLLREMVHLAEEMKHKLSKGQIEVVGELLDLNWNLKKQLSSAISNTEIDNMYEIAKKKGALGGKILGAGGGGFLLLFAPKSKHKNITNALNKLKRYEIKFESFGSKIIFSC